MVSNTNHSSWENFRLYGSIETLRITHEFKEFTLLFSKPESCQSHRIKKSQAIPTELFPKLVEMSSHFREDKNFTLTHNF